jgi:hypothetical protein
VRGSASTVEKKNNRTLPHLLYMPSHAASVHKATVGVVRPNAAKRTPRQGSARA